MFPLQIHQSFLAPCFYLCLKRRDVNVKTGHFGGPPGLGFVTLACKDEEDMNSPFSVSPNPAKSNSVAPTQTFVHTFVYYVFSQMVGEDDE